MKDTTWTTANSLYIRRKVFSICRAWMWSAEVSTEGVLDERWSCEDNRFYVYVYIKPRQLSIFLSQPMAPSKHIFASSDTHVL